MGGELTLEHSAPGAGATFVLWLPGTAAGDNAAARSARAERLPAPLGAARPAERAAARERRRGAPGVRGLRTDPATPAAHALAGPHLKDHQVTFVADLAQSLVIVAPRPRSTRSSSPTAAPSSA